MQEHNHVQSSEQQTLSSTAPYANFLYSAANNYNIDSNRGQYGVMTPYSMYPMNQWPHTEGINVPSTNLTGNETTTVSSNLDTISVSSSVASNVPIMSVNQAAPVSSSMNMVSNPGTVGNNIPPFMGTPVSSTYGVGDFCQFPIAGIENNVKLSKCALYPPYLPTPPTRSSKPFECNTIYVGGLPEKATKDAIKEVFMRFGEIFSIKMAKKSCTIRFVRQASVEFAFMCHGWEIKIENKDDAPYTGKLYIDYARNNEHLIDGAQQEAQEDASRRETTESDFLSPQQFVPCSEQEIILLAAKLNDENDFEEAVRLLIAWLDKGECNKRNASSFYSFIQKTNNHVQKLMNEKAKFEEGLNKAKLTLHDKMLGITAQLNEFEKVLYSSRLQKVWDHFSKAQRKNIDAWGKEISDIKILCSDELIHDRVEDEMEMSDEEGNKPANENKEIKTRDVVSEQIDDLQNELCTAELERKVVKKEAEKELIVLRQRFHNVSRDLEDNVDEIANLKRLIENADLKERTQECGKQSKGQHSSTDPPSGTSESIHQLCDVTDLDIRQIGLISTFLNAHPFGASLDYISSYLCAILPDINARDIEHLMKQFPLVFIEQSMGIGSTLRKKWTFAGY